ncbi:rRNA maturation RNase YbeY [Patescibacteria group bacterium]|nr:rRNA maturation RNase YbeY [Patescibacteria group bacterium]MBU1663568.1 rRNA maturation RNase YbeY [Patescibacteria group bacterium]MBU1934194.1 rRNA maturation RNase YbeY [Patescibacteria group bacterium]MBU2007592.1 rRNA maturation RNase YbeY [Patescibacteria group bacterium]MBU2233804.1 rRNA maturation RNase YbeY [Patescibacteria group bacterium]
MKVEINNQTNYKINLKLIEKAVKVFGQVYKIKNKEFSLAFVGDAEIKKLNLTYRGLNKATDVLSFSGDGDYLGEIIINYNQVKLQAGDFKNSAEKELIFILVHGLLHLIGYDDKTDKQRKKMIKLGENFIKSYL